MGRYSVLLLLMISATSVGLPVQFQDQATAGSDSPRYVIIFDAGSTKTKMEIYKINVNAPPLDVTDIQELDPSPSKAKPGIANLAGNPSAVEGYLMPLLDSVKKTVPALKHKSTPIFFLATAGMRLLRKDQSNAILEEVKKLFNDKDKCPFMFDSKDAQIISGALEGVYGWISVNFLASNFIPGNSDNTYGILDLGGASHQNTFEYPGNDTLSITVGSKKYHIFARSYLGYGMSQARKRYLEILSKQSTTNGVIQSPCHHQGFQGKIRISGKTFMVVGTASVDACRSVIEKAFFCKTPDCPFYDQPKLHGDFVGFSGIFYAAYGTGMLCYHCMKHLSPGMFDNSSRNFCAKKYQDVNSDPYAKNNCFQSNYVYELLTKGYGLSDDKMIQVGKYFYGFSLGWTLGAMLHNSDLL